MRRLPARLLSRLVVVLTILVALSVAAVAVLWVVTPSVTDAQSRVAARVHAGHGVALNELPRPDPVGAAIVATEDSRFYSHHGVDPVGVARALLALARGAGDPGGATLDQQLAKNIYSSGSDSAAAKVEQMVLALKLDATYTKAQVLAMYLSAVYFGHGFYGLPAAARGYFATTPDRLDWAQASLLAGLVQAPTAYDPYLHPDLARSRQRHVLDRLVATGVLTAGQADAAFAQRWHLRR